MRCFSISDSTLKKKKGRKTIRKSSRKSPLKGTYERNTSSLGRFATCESGNDVGVVGRFCVIRSATGMLIKAYYFE